MSRPTSRMLAVVCVAVATAQQTAPAAEPANEQAQTPTSPFRGALLSSEQVSESRLRSLKSVGITAVALQLRGGADSRTKERQACERIRQSNLGPYYWIEVARCPELADAHPDWMASLQGHSEWRRLFEDPPTPRADEVVKTYPWVPILNEEAFPGATAASAKVTERPSAANWRFPQRSPRRAFGLWLWQSPLPLDQ